ncbi:hypothetical protein [Halorhodospira neutriphila]|uniref:Fimbrial assembly family protein n=1 Tax=Halorhodospira neutriphila TaxID=168379 RepID=A0ABS1E2A4_9GAMM|nr:hypothetical protein [Halorhodospira neutriphila]MBK1725821.1 hypothetical protein [Halorhodospira neutriphila]
MAFVSTLLVTMDRLRAEDGTQRARYALLRGRRIDRRGSCTLDELGGLRAGRLRASLLSPLTHLERVELEAFRRRLVPFVARRYLDGESIFTEPYRLRTRVARLAEGRADTYMMAMAEDDVALAAEALPRSARPAELLTAGEAAIAALVGRVTREPSMAYWARGTFFLALFIENGRVRWRRTERVFDRGPGAEEEVGGEAGRYERLIDAAESGLTAEHERALRYRFALGDLVGTPMRRDEAAQERSQLEARMAGLLAGAAENAILHEPELYGLAFVPSWADMQEADYQHQVLAHRIATPAAGIAAAVGVALAGAGAYQLSQAVAAEGDLKVAQERYQARRAELQEQRPPAGALEELDAALSLHERERRALRLDRFLAWLAEQIPAEGHVRSLSLEARDGDDEEQPAEAFAADLEVELAGGYDRARGLAEATVSRLGERVELSGSEFRYEPAPERQGRGVLSSRLSVQAEAF